MARLADVDVAHRWSPRPRAPINRTLYLIGYVKARENFTRWAAGLPYFTPSAAEVADEPEDKGEAEAQ